jgi:transcriptional regulator with XRE-family HTH domain
MTPAQLITLRTAAGWTQTAAAAFLGLSIRQYQRYETAARIPKPVQISMLLAAPKTPETLEQLERMLPTTQENG